MYSMLSQHPFKINLETKIGMHQIYGGVLSGDTVVRNVHQCHYIVSWAKWYQEVTKTMLWLPNIFFSACTKQCFLFLMIRVHNPLLAFLWSLWTMNLKWRGRSNSLKFYNIHVFSFVIRHPIQGTRTSDLSEPQILGMGRTIFPSESLRMIVNGSLLTPLPGSQIHCITCVMDIWCVLEDGTSSSQGIVTKLVPQLQLSLQSGIFCMAGNMIGPAYLTHGHVHTATPLLL